MVCRLQNRPRRHHILSLVTAFVLSWGLLSAVPVEAAEKIHVDRELLLRVNHNPSTRLQLMHILGIAGNPNQHEVRDIKLGGNAKVELARSFMDRAASQYQYITATTYDNCRGVANSRDIQLTHGVDTGVEWSVANSFGDKVSAEAELPIGGTAFGSGLSADFTLGDGGSETTSTSVSAEQEVDFPDVRGVYLFALYAHTVSSGQDWIPFWIDFIPSDDTAMTFVFRDFDPRNSKAVVTFYVDQNWKGGSISYRVGDVIRPLPDVFHNNIESMKIPEDVRVRFYVNTQDDWRFYTAGWFESLYDWNNRTQGAAIEADKNVEKDTTWAEVASAFPAADRTFRIHGRMRFHQVDGKDVKMLAYRLSDEASAEACASLEQPLGSRSRRRSGKSDHHKRGLPSDTGHGKRISPTYFNKIVAAGDVHSVNL